MTIRNTTKLSPVIARALEASEPTRAGCILRCAAGQDPLDGDTRQFHGKACITSDGFLLCDFTDSHGNFHMGAFVG